MRGLVRAHAQRPVPTSADSRHTARTFRGRETALGSHGGSCSSGRLMNRVVQQLYEHGNTMPESIST